MKIFTYNLVILFFLFSCQENNNEDLIQGTWKVTVGETESLGIAFTKQNRMLNEIYNNLSFEKKEENSSKFDTVKILRLKIIKEAKLNLIKLKNHPKTKANEKILSATKNLIVSLLEVENSLPNIYSKVDKNINNKNTLRNEKFLEVVNRYEKNGKNYDAVKDEYYEKNKNVIETRF